jgi:streptogramin lyase
VLRINGDLTGQPQFTAFDTGVAGPSVPVVDDDGALWFGNGSASPAVVRIDGDLAATPTITLINTDTPSAAFPILDDLGDIWFGTTDPAGSSNVVRLS